MRTDKTRLKWLLFAVWGASITFLFCTSFMFGGVYACEIQGEGTLDGLRCVQPVITGYCEMPDTGEYYADPFFNVTLENGD